MMREHAYPRTGGRKHSADERDSTMAQTRKRRRFSKIFEATITFGDEIVVSETKHRVVYARSPETKVVLPDGSTVKRTVMAFGDQLMKVQPDIMPGGTVRLAVQHDRGSVKIVGYPRGAEPAPERDAVLESEAADAA